LSSFCVIFFIEPKGGFEMKEEKTNRLIFDFFKRKNCDFSHNSAEYYFNNSMTLSEINGKRVEDRTYIEPMGILGEKCEIYETYAMDPWNVKGVFTRDKKGRLIFIVERFGNYEKLSKPRIFTVRRIREEISLVREYPLKLRL